MDLNYITQLTEEEIKALINFCIQKQNERYQKEGIETRVSQIKQVYISSEEDRKDLEGKRYMWVRTADGIKILNSYRIQDFSISIDDMVSYGQYASKDYTGDMRIFMTKRFGSDYVKVLYQNQVSQAEQELNRLSNYIEPKKQI